MTKIKSTLTVFSISQEELKLYATANQLKSENEKITKNLGPKIKDAFATDPSKIEGGEYYVEMRQSTRVDVPWKDILSRHLGEVKVRVLEDQWREDDRQFARRSASYYKSQLLTLLGQLEYDKVVATYPDANKIPYRELLCFYYGLPEVEKIASAHPGKDVESLFVKRRV